MEKSQTLLYRPQLSTTLHMGQLMPDFTSCIDPEELEPGQRAKMTCINIFKSTLATGQKSHE